MQRSAPDVAPSRVRAILGAFMFSGDDIDKPVKVLSGGEKARVALARLLVKPGNLMLMDEPTNHLDLSSSESLTASLKTYDGTLVFVSHNRSLVRALATRIWNVEDQKVETYPGTLDEYLYSMNERRTAVAATDTETAQRRTPKGTVKVAPVVVKPPEGDAAQKRDPRGASPTATPKSAVTSKEDDKVRKRREAETRQKRNAKLGPLEKLVAQLEERVGVLEAEQKARSAELADPTVYDEAARRNKLLSDYQSAADKLEELTGRWEKAMAELEVARAQLEASGD